MFRNKLRSLFSIRNRSNQELNEEIKISIGEKMKERRSLKQINLKKKEK